MGVLPLQFKASESWESLGIVGDETIDIEIGPRPQAAAGQSMRDPTGRRSSREVPLSLRIDTAIEVDYYRHGGILPYVLRELLAA